MGYILTVDIGTTGCKCSLFQEDLYGLACEVAAYGMIQPQGGWAEQNPKDFYEGAKKGIHALLQKTKVKGQDILALSLSGHMNGCIPVDKDGGVLYPDIIHADTRAVAECRTIEKEVGQQAFYALTGNRIDPHFSLPKYLWLKNQLPDVYGQTAFFLNSKDYLFYRLTGRLGVTDYSDAALCCALDMEKKVWDQGLFRTLGLDRSKMPDILPSATQMPLTQEAAHDLGLPQGLPVFLGGGDGACSTRGAGVDGYGKAYNYIGSSAWIAVLSQTLHLDKQARTFNFFDLDGNSYVSCGTVQSAAAAYDWAAGQLCQTEIQKALKKGIPPYEDLDMLAGSAPIGADGVFFLPHLMGERTPYWDPYARGAFFGFSLHHTRAHLMRAVYEGVAFALKNVLETHLQNGLQVKSLALIGGGAKSLFWNTLMCHIYNLPIFVPQAPGTATARGAAMAAGVGLGIFKDYDEAARSVAVERSFTPEAEKAKAYRKVYDRYVQLYPALKPLWMR